MEEAVLLLYQFYNAILTILIKSGINANKQQHEKLLRGVSNR